jgi:hypothetical protein
VPNLVVKLLILQDSQFGAKGTELTLLFGISIKPLFKLLPATRRSTHEEADLKPAIFIPLTRLLTRKIMFQHTRRKP